MTGGELLLAVCLDAGAGDPRWFPHPVRGMGMVINRYEKHIRKLSGRPSMLRLGGIGLALGLPLAVFVVCREVLAMADSIGWWVGSLASIGLAWTTMAARDLWDHARAVSEQLEQDNLPGARRAVAMIVGRDTEDLFPEDLARAAIETVAESTSDGVIAPLFYLAIGGAPLALAYKAVNTLDSMIGHKDERYVDFGWASARLDDLANWIPARLEAGLTIVAAGVVARAGAPMKTAWRVLWRDGEKHPSPNSGLPEAAMAGALGIQLGGTNYYGGVADHRSVIGACGRQPTVADMKAASRMMVVVSVLGVAMALGILWLVEVM